VSKPRFIAGAVCDVCGSLDRIVLEQTGSGLVKRCVQCGDSAALAVHASRNERSSSAERIIVRSSVVDER